jgi:glutamate dehydrogenase
MDGELLAAFPNAMVKSHKSAILAHRLRKEIIATKLANRMINRLGMLHPFELAEEVRAEAVSVIEQLKQLGMQLKVLSGDAQSAVAQVASMVALSSGVSFFWESMLWRMNSLRLKSSV